MNILYAKGETDFIGNGIAVLDNALISAKITEDTTSTDYLNRYYAEYELEVNSEEAQLIEKDMIIKSPIPNSQEDYFVVSKIRKDLDVLYVKAIQIFFTMEDNFIEDTNIVDKTGYAALDQMQKATQYKHKFNFYSDISTVNSARMVRKNFVSALIGDDDNSFVSRWDGELRANKFDVYMNSTRGQDRGVSIEYRKNLTGLDAIIDYDSEEYYTRVMPEGYNGLFLDEKYVDSPLMDSSRPKIRKIEFSDIKVKQNADDEEGYVSEEDAKNALREAAEKLFSIEHHDIPPASYEINFEELTSTEEYKNYTCLERIWMGDTVTVKHREIGVNISARLVKYEFDAITETYTSLQLGNAVNGITSQYKDLSKKIDNDIEGVKTDFQQRYDEAVSELTGMIISGAHKGHTYTTKNEYMVMDTTDPLTAVNVARFNVNGIGFSTTGINGPYVGLTNNGKLVITEATAMKFTAALVETGILQSIDGKCWINLDNSTFNFDNYISLLEDTNGNRTFKIKLSDGTDLEEKLNTVVTQSEVMATADQIKMSVGETGAYNMVKNSRAEQTTNFWHGTVLRFGNSSNAKLTNGTYFRVDNDTTSEKYMYSDIFAVKPNTTYTLALTVMRSAYCKNIDIHFLGLKDKTKVDTNTLSYDYTHTVVANKVYAEGAWIKEVVTFKTKSDELCGYLRFDNNGSSQAGTLCKAYFTDILMYEGTIKNSKGDIIAKPWSPYPAELYGSSVVVDKKGLEVKNSNGDRVFRADTEEGVSLTGNLLQYDLNTGNYSLEIANNMINFFDRWDTLGNHKNLIGNMGSTQVKGSYFGYNIGNTQNTRVGIGIIADIGDFIALCSKDANGNNNPMFIMENSDSLNINQGNRFGFMQDVAFLNGAYPKWYGTLHNFIGDIHFDANSRMNIWGAGGHILTVGTKNIMTTSETGVTVYGTFTDSSDLAYKKNVQPLGKDTLKILKDINIYEYEENGTVEIGLLAQEAKEIIPDIIKGTVTDTTIEEANTMTDEEREEKLKNGGASVDVYSMLSILWDANKKLLNKIDMLENEVKILKERG